MRRFVKTENFWRLATKPTSVSIMSGRRNGLSASGEGLGKKVRVAHVGTGHTGREALRGILARPDLELVSLWVSSPDKVGRDLSLIHI